MAHSTTRAIIPGSLNFLIQIVATALCIGSLWVSSHTSSSLILVLSAICFSFICNTQFSLLHEAVHGLLYSNRKLNYLGGCIAAAFFPTAFSLQRAYHLTHHQNNRSPIERFDYIQAGESKWLKYAQWYSILTGIYWLVSVLGLLAYFFAPLLLRRKSLRSKSSTIANQTSSGAYLAAMDNLPKLTARLEIIVTILVQLAMFYLLDGSIIAWIVCYAMFGLNWSSLQYADHAFSPLDNKNGAWNLKVNPVFRAFFLNYHYHLAHHQHPQVPWLYLKDYVKKDAPMPRYFSIWLSMWKGPRPLPSEKLE